MHDTNWRKETWLVLCGELPTSWAVPMAAQQSFGGGAVVPDLHPGDLQLREPRHAETKRRLKVSAT